MSPTTKLRLMLVLGVVMIALTTFVVLYGFKRTEELRSEAHTQELMRQPRTASYGSVPVGLAIGMGGSVMPAEGQAQFDDGLVVTLVNVERQKCAECGPDGNLVATFLLMGGNVGQANGLQVKLSPLSPRWNDQGYLMTLLDIDPRGCVFTVDRTKL